MGVISDILAQHTEYRRSTLNLIPSENIMFDEARQVLSSDLVHRYVNPEGFYGGTKFTDEIVEKTKQLAEDLFGADYAFVEPLSGHIADLCAVFAFTKAGDKVMLVSPEDGGYPLDLEHLERKPVYFPFDRETWNIDISKAEEKIKSEKPSLIILGQSFYLFPHPVKQIASVADDLNIPVVYDGSHVLGLIAGEQFQNPFKEGAKIIVGSTHKTFPGPQGGVIVGLGGYGKAEFAEVLGMPLVLVDNPHLHRIAALGVTIEKFKPIAKDYAQRVVKNAQTLANELDKRGVLVGFSKLGYTKSHQVYLPVKSMDEGKKIYQKLEKAGIIADCAVRLGTQEVTMLGMEEEDMKTIAEFIADVLVDGKEPEKVKKDVMEFVKHFTIVEEHKEEKKKIN